MFSVNSVDCVCVWSVKNRSHQAEPVDSQSQHPTPNWAKLTSTLKRCSSPDTAHKIQSEVCSHNTPAHVCSSLFRLWNDLKIMFMFYVWRLSKYKNLSRCCPESSRVRWEKPLWSEGCCDLQRRVLRHGRHVSMKPRCGGMVNHILSPIFDARLDYLGNAFPLLLTVTFPVAYPASLQVTFMRVCDDTHELAPALWLSQQHGLEFTSPRPRILHREQSRSSKAR